jgi:hypothetical protein
MFSQQGPQQPEPVILPLLMRSRRGNQVAELPQVQPQEPWSAPKAGDEDLP